MTPLVLELWNKYKTKPEPARSEAWVSRVDFEAAIEEAYELGHEAGIKYGFAMSEQERGGE